ncbi:O-methyltransferase [Clostridiaceae bacterium HSG29]|nr:O-methyltransferase [Clostridiaceae bacterium HSG29]
MSYYPGKINDEYVKEYIEKIIPKEENEFIYELRKYANEKNVPIIEVETEKMLEVFIKASNIKSILEVGTAIGYSSIIFSRAMNYNGKLTSLEINKETHEIAKKNIKEYKESLNIDFDIKLVLADAKTGLESVKGIYDLIFIDAAKGHYKKFYDQITENLKEGSIIISDNVLFKGMIATDEYMIRRKKTIVKRMREYIDFLMNSPLLTTTVIPIGDGVAISYYNGGQHE